MSIEVMKFALGALEDIFGKNKVDVGAITALRQAIEQAEKRKPVAWMYVNFDGECAPKADQIEYSQLQQMRDKCDSYMEIHDAIATDNDLLYAILRHAEVEMRYAGWGEKQEDNYGRYEVYNRIQEVVKEKHT